MGQAESLSISGGDGHRYWVSIKPKPMGKGRKKTVYKGILLGHGPRQGEKVIVKAFSDITGTHEAWSYEVTKADVAKQMKSIFLDSFAPNTKIRIVMPGIVEMDKVSKFDNWLEVRQGGRGLNKDEWISIEEEIKGKFCRYCPWTSEISNSKDVITHSDILQTFSHFTYKHSCGEFIACDFQGTSRPLSQDKTLFILTDSILHSRRKLYGIFDEGEYGITEFFKLHKCTDICKNWPKPCPLTPPPSFDEACTQRLLTCSSPPVTFTDVVFPSYQLDSAIEASESTLHRSPNRRRHSSERHTRRNRSQLIRQAPVSIEPIQSPCSAIPCNTNLSVDDEMINSLRRRSHSNAGESMELFQNQLRLRSYTHAEVTRPDYPVYNSGSNTPPPAYETVCPVATLHTDQTSSHPDLENQLREQQIASEIDNNHQQGISTTTFEAGPSQQSAENHYHHQILRRSSTVPTHIGEDSTFQHSDRPAVFRSLTFPIMSETENQATYEVRGQAQSEDNTTCSMPSLLQRRVNSVKGQSQQQCTPHELHPLHLSTPTFSLPFSPPAQVASAAFAMATAPPMTPDENLGT